MMKHGTWTRAVARAQLHNAAQRGAQNKPTRQIHNSAKFRVHEYLWTRESCLVSWSLYLLQSRPRAKTELGSQIVGTPHLWAGQCASPPYLQPLGAFHFLEPPHNAPLLQQYQPLLLPTSRQIEVAGSRRTRSKLAIPIIRLR